MRGLNHLPRTQLAGIDIGGTKTHLRFSRPESTDVVQISAHTGAFNSFQELLGDCFQSAGCVPLSLVAGVAGRPQADGRVRLTNRPKWPIFDPKPFAADLGMHLVIVNDMIATAASIGRLEDDGYSSLLPDVPRVSSLASVVVAVGTGVGVSTIDADGTIHSTEAGHIPWQPIGPLEVGYLREHERLKPRVPLSVESAISGHYGFTKMYDHVAASAPASREIQSAIARSASEGVDPGPEITAGAAAGDRCCLTVMELFGGILGGFLRSMALAFLSSGGSIWLAGSVLQAPDIADLIMSKTDFIDRFIDRSTEHSDLMSEIPIYLITDRDAAAKGAFAMCADIRDS